MTCTRCSARLCNILPVTALDDSPVQTPRLVCTSEMCGAYKWRRSSARESSHTLMIFNTMIQKASLGIATSAWGPTFGKSKARTSPGYASKSDLLRRRANPFSMFAFLASGKKASTLSGAWPRLKIVCPPAPPAWGKCGLHPTPYRSLGLATNAAAAAFVTGAAPGMAIGLNGLIQAFAF